MFCDEAAQGVVQHGCAVVEPALPRAEDRSVAHALDAADLAEAFAARKVPTKVISVPATIDGDLYNNGIEASIGFDTACRVYASAAGQARCE